MGEVSDHRRSPGHRKSEADGLKIVLGVAESDDRSVRAWAYGMPAALAFTQIAEVVDALGMMLLGAADDGVTGTERAVLVPCWIGVDIPPVRQTDADVKPDFGCAHYNPSKG